MPKDLKYITWSLFLLHTSILQEENCSYKGLSSAQPLQEPIEVLRLRMKRPFSPPCMVLFICQKDTKRVTRLIEMTKYVT
jgi:hypothetical protein